MFAMGGRIGATANVGNTTKPGKFSLSSFKAIILSVRYNTNVQVGFLRTRM